MNDQINRDGITRTLKKFRRGKHVEWHRLSGQAQDVEDQFTRWPHDRLKELIIDYYTEVKDLANKSA